MVFHPEIGSQARLGPLILDMCSISPLLGFVLSCYCWGSGGVTSEVLVHHLV